MRIEIEQTDIDAIANARIRIEKSRSENARELIRLGLALFEDVKAMWDKHVEGTSIDTSGPDS